MKVVRITGLEAVDLVDRPDPHPHGEFVVVKVEVAPMCTEYKAFAKGWISDSLGHEAAGTVVQSDGRRKVEVGQRVLVLPQYPCGSCRLCLLGEYVYCEHSLDALKHTNNPAGTATYAQYLIKQDWMLYPIPEDVSTEHASLANCALGPAFGALKLAEVNALDTVLITGLGPVGLGAVILAKRLGAKVVATDPLPFRAALARRLGADAVYDPEDERALSQVRAIGIDKVIECSGTPSAQRFGIDAIRRLGIFVFVGEANELSLHVSEDFIRNGLTAIGSWYYNMADVPVLMNLIRELASPLDLLVTHRYPMSQVAEAFRQQLTGHTGKVLLDPWA